MSSVETRFTRAKPVFDKLRNQALTFEIISFHVFWSSASDEAKRSVKINGVEMVINKDTGADENIPQASLGFRVHQCPGSMG